MKIAVSYFDKLSIWPNKNFQGICDSLLHVPCDVIVAKYTPQELLEAKDYDAVFLLRGGEAMTEEHIRHYKNNHILVALWHDDVYSWKASVFPCHSKPLMAWFEVADLLFVLWIEVFLRFRQYDKFKNKVVWSPWSASDQILDTDVDWPSRKDKILLSGNLSKHYPFRRCLAEYSATDPGRAILDRIEHHGYRPKSQDQMITGQAYYDCLKTYRGAAVTAAAKPVNFHLAKYMEVCACGCLPFLEHTPDIHYLGFVDGMNCILINQRDYKEKFGLIRSDRAPIIARNARELVKSRHLHSHRAKAIISAIVSKMELR
jgi:hypothetical protein